MNERVVTLGTETTVSLRLVLAAFTFTFMIMGGIWGIYFRLTQIEYRLSAGWTAEQMLVYTRKMQDNNPTLRVPTLPEVNKEVYEMHRTDGQQTLRKPSSPSYFE